MNGLLDTLGALCGPDQAARGLLLVPALLLAGLAGSVVHCTAMCGPFVLGQAADRMARLPAGRMCEAARLRGGLLLPYHAGRLATYCGLGVAAGWLGTAAMPAALPGVLLALAAGTFLLVALGRARVSLWPSMAGMPASLPSMAGLPAFLPFMVGMPARFARLAGPAGRLGGLPLGLALGFLPCGMVYAALAAAASSGPVVGGAAMLAFGLGTVPALAAIALFGHAAARRWQGASNRLAPWLLGANAALLAALSWQTLAA